MRITAYAYYDDFIKGIYMKKKYLLHKFVPICAILFIVSTLLFSNINLRIQSAFSIPEEALVASFENSGLKKGEYNG
ncbi:MAG: hypothetical protein GYA02_09150 [Clostridiaceae bacterium]|jgi:hypothetical protein|nr:hypothetical protein [Clostridiaceae bacterium]